MERNGGEALEAMLRDKQATVPDVPELMRNDLIAMAVWYTWWERRQVSHGEAIQAHPS
jgi:hypothetical protein